MSHPGGRAYHIGTLFLRKAVGRIKENENNLITSN
jgi:hypothetical protein